MPISFLVDDHGVEFWAILESWRELDLLCFRVETEDGGIYYRRQHEHEDSWQVRELLKRR